MSDNIRLKIFRYDPDTDAAPRYQTYEFVPDAGMTVLLALFYVLENMDKTLAFRYSCRSAVCGSCAMHINGKNRLACETQVTEVGPDITVEPLPHLTVIKDLVVDMEPFWDKYEKVRPYLITLTENPEKERRQSVEERKRIDEYIDCILCACCYSSCSVDWWDKDYLGPAALTKAYRFLADSRDEGKSDRLRLLANDDGLFRCHTIFNCTEECPKKISPTQAIQNMKKDVLIGKLTGKF